jgi:transcriptional regulator with XRE-family HTH domain
MTSRLIKQSPGSIPELSTPISTIGEEIRLARKSKKLTLVELGKKTNLSVSYLSQVERNIIASSVSSLKRIAEILNMPASAIMFSEARKKSTTHSVGIVRANQRMKIEFPGSDIIYEMLTPDLKRKVSLFWINLPPGSQSGVNAFSHEGEDAVIVLEGQLRVNVGDNWYTLNKNDCLYFESELPHQWKNESTTYTVAIWMSTPPSF